VLATEQFTRDLAALAGKHAGRRFASIFTLITAVVD
jgi:hypothetical protein